MSYQHIILDYTGNVATLTLNRPQALNAVNAPMIEEMLDVLGEIEKGGQARVLLITGAGRAFCSGADIVGSGIGTGEVDAGQLLGTHLNPLVEAMFDLSVPIVSAVNGPAAGAGCSIALAADIVIAARSAYFLQAFVNIGLVPDVGSTWMLPHQVGRARATAMMMLGEKIPADMAETWGLIWKAVDDDQLVLEADKAAARLAAGPTQALMMIRKAIRTALEEPLTATLALERSNQQTAGRTADFKEGVAAFAAKRPAVFQGR